jgi:N-acyl amino acid synthase of PEP-CTERM/exosortase system
MTNHRSRVEIEGSAPDDSIMSIANGKFRFLIAESGELKREIWRLRYRVYVEECGFERVEDHPSGLEMDEYEPHALHLAAVDDAYRVIGTIRLILNSEKGFPMEHAAPLDFPGPKPPPDRTAEISRLAIDRLYRRRAHDGLYGIESYITTAEGGILPVRGEAASSEEGQRVQPVIVLGLYQLMYRVSKRLGLTHWYMIAERKLWYALKRYHFVFQQIGEPLHYHGIRIPYLGDIAEIEAEVKQHAPQLFDATVTALEEPYRPNLSQAS